MALSSPDYISIENLFKAKDFASEWESNYNSVNALSLYDSYGAIGNPLTLNTQQFSAQFVNYAESYYMLPIKVSTTTGTPSFTGVAGYLNVAGTGATAAYPTSGIAWKCCSLPIIYGMSVTSNAGATLINETPGAMAYVNGLRALYDMDMSYAGEQSLIDFFGKDVNTGSTMFFGAVTTGQPQPQIAGNVAIQPAGNLNPTFLNRCNMWLMKSSGASASYFANGAANTYTLVTNPCYYNCFLKLSLLHDAFKQLNRPIQNFPLVFTFTISGSGAGSQLMPLALADTARGFTGSYLQVAPAPNAVAINGYALAQSRLLLKVVVMSSKDLEAYNRMCEEGAEQSIEYLTTDIYTGSQYQASLSTYGASVLHQVNNNTIMPYRLRVLSYALSNTLIAHDPNRPENLFPGGWHNDAINWTNVNVLINGSQFYVNDLLTPMEIFDLIKSEAPYGVRAIQQSGSQLGFDSFINGVTDLVFPLKRYKQPNVNNICNIQFKGTFGNNLAGLSSGTIQFVYLVERVLTLKLKYTKSGVITQVVQGRDLSGVSL